MGDILLLIVLIMGAFLFIMVMHADYCKREFMRKASNIAAPEIVKFVDGCVRAGMTEVGTGLFNTESYNIAVLCHRKQNVVMNNTPTSNQVHNMVRDGILHKLHQAGIKVVERD